MNIMELGAIGELVGGVAVIASLVFVGMQIRRGNEQVQRGNAMERARTNLAQSQRAEARGNAPKALSYCNQALEKCRNAMQVESMQDIAREFQSRVTRRRWYLAKQADDESPSAQESSD